MRFLRMWLFFGGVMLTLFLGWAALIGVPTLIAGVYGMNFKAIPELEWAYGYLYSLALMAGADAILYLWFKRIRWL